MRVGVSVTRWRRNKFFSREYELVWQSLKEKRSHRGWGKERIWDFWRGEKHSREYLAAAKLFLLTNCFSVDPEDVISNCLWQRSALSNGHLKQDNKLRNPQLRFLTHSLKTFFSARTTTSANYYKWGLPHLGRNFHCKSIPSHTLDMPLKNRPLSRLGLFALAKLFSSHEYEDSFV